MPRLRASGPLFTVVGVLALAQALVGCGGSDTSTPAPAPSSDPVAQVDSLGISFALPEGWVSVKPTPPAVYAAAPSAGGDPLIAVTPLSGARLPSAAALSEQVRGAGATITATSSGTLFAGPANQVWYETGSTRNWLVAVKRGAHVFELRLTGANARLRDNVADTVQGTLTRS